MFLLVQCVVFMPTGGEVKFDVSNDAPTLTGAKVTFTIDIIFPDNQMVLPNGEVVWGKNCFVNGMSLRHLWPDMS